MRCVATGLRWMEGWGILVITGRPTNPTFESLLLVWVIEPWVWMVLVRVQYEV